MKNYENPLSFKLNREDSEPITEKDLEIIEDKELDKYYKKYLKNKSSRYENDTPWG